MKIIKKRMLVFLIVGILMLSGMLAFADESVTFHVERTLDNGIVSISIEAPENSGITNGKLVFNYDKNVMKLSSANEGELLKDCIVDINTKVPGVVSVVWVGEALTQKGAIVDMVFSTSTTLDKIDMALGSNDLYAGENRITAKNDIPVEHTVTYDLNGGNGTAPTQASLKENETFKVAGITGITAPSTKKFKEWNTSANGTGSGYQPEATFTMGAENVTLYAIWIDDISNPDNPGGGDNSGGNNPSGGNTSGGNVTQPEKPKYNFSDVKGHWAYNEIYKAVEAGLFIGTSDTTFSPEAQMNRAMFVTVLWRIEGSPSIDNKASFSDVEANSWYENAVSWAYKNGIVNGKGESTFAPLDNISREEMVTMLARYAKYKGTDISKKADLSNFVDNNKISSYAKDSIAWAVQAGIITGKPGNLIDPSGLATRAECAVIFCRYIEK